MIYTGIGSRQTPRIILDMMTEIGMSFASNGYILRSGGAQGADHAFEIGARFYNGAMEIYLPFQNRPSHITDKALKIAEKVWEERDVSQAWRNLEPYTKLIMARNIMQVLGRNLETPTDIVICWTPEGEMVGGTGQALHLAIMLGIPILNLAMEKDRLIIQSVLRGDITVPSYLKENTNASKQKSASGSSMVNENHNQKES